MSETPQWEYRILTAGSAFVLKEVQAEKVSLCIANN